MTGDQDPAPWPARPRRPLGRRCPAGVPALALALALLAPGLPAQETGAEAVVRGGDPTAARTVTARLDPAVCRRLLADGDVPGADYVPGIDVDGNPVAPADLPQTPQWPDLQTLVVPLTLDLATVADLPAGVGADLPLFALTVDPLGRVRLDGRPLDPAAEPAVVEACRRALGNR
jgi:hypothetical protein